LELLKAAARQRLAAGQGELELGVTGAGGVGGRGGRGVDGGPLPITSTRMAHLWDALGQVFDLLGFDAASELEEIGIQPCSYPTLPGFRLPGARSRGRPSPGSGGGTNVSLAAR
jgi:hypothetical protein